MTFLSWYFSKSAFPYWSLLILDCIIVVTSGVMSTYLFLGGMGIIDHFWNQIGLWVLFLPFFMLGMRIFHTYAGVIRYSSFSDLLRITCALFVGFGLAALCMFVIPEEVLETRFRLRVLGGALLISMFTMWSVRILVKFLYDTSLSADATRFVFIYGVKQGGAALAKSIRNQHPARYLVKGFLTKDECLIGRYLMGTKVYKDSPEVINEMQHLGVSVLFVSPLCNEIFRNNTELVAALTKAGITIMMMPEAETWDGKSDLSHSMLHEVQIEDLLPRDKISVDLEAIGQLLSGKSILITGAAGSIGSEIVRQVAQFSPAKMVLIDQAETPMHDLRLYMASHFADIPCLTIVGSITNESLMDTLFREHRPDYVFHAAAYKHVPMLEDNPAMAIQNNVYGTRIIADLAVKYGTQKFVMISTDKAVNPTNVMGCSKRICEIYCQSLNKAIADGTLKPQNLTTTEPHNHRTSQPQNLTTQFITTRFGNVLGSNGSVIPIFREQIKRGGPITVTHPDIIRYFMLIPEACQLVLEAGTMGHGGEIFVFDMGRPVRIADLAQRMIELSGARNVEIQYTGLRDGEKLYEEVLNDMELTKPTIHPKILVASVREYPYAEVLQDIDDLYRLSFTYSDMDIVRKMKQIVPEYISAHSKYESLD